MRRNLVILADFGLDDAAAVAHLLARREMFLRIDIVCVAGNVSAHKSFVNAKKLLAAIGGDNEGIRLVDTSFIEQRYNELPDVHGGDGMGNLFAEGDIDIECVCYEDFLAEFDPQEDIVLSLGMLRVTRDILQKRGEIERLVIMAGLEKAKPNFKGLEFNQALDKASCTFCFSYPHVVATLDTCRAEKFNLIDFAPPKNSAFGRILDRAISLARARHPDNAFVYDLIASLYLTEPSIFEARVCTDPCGNRINQLQLCEDFDFKSYLLRYL